MRSRRREVPAEGESGHRRHGSRQRPPNAPALRSRSLTWYVVTMPRGSWSPWRADRAGRFAVFAALVVTVASLRVAAAPHVARAESAADVLGRVRALDEGPRKWSDRTEKVRLTIVDAGGKERVREFESFNRRLGGGEEKALVFFRAPAELRGTGFLQWAHAAREDEQWLYLPELKRTRQISARAKKESFAGTDFSFRDLEIINEITRWTDDEATVALAGEETVGGEPAYVLRFTPHDPDTIGYAAIRLWERKQDVLPVKMEFAGTDGPLKVLELGDFRTTDGIPTPYRLEMKNLKTGGRTVVDVLELSHNRGLDDDLFTQRTLERGGP